MEAKSKTLSHQNCNMTFVFIILTFELSSLCFGAHLRQRMNNQAARMMSDFTYAQRGWIIQLPDLFGEHTEYEHQCRLHFVTLKHEEGLQSDVNIGFYP